ncbi:MAG: AI-2E family transporter [Acidobacteriia bacterium]|nr:AI-2E family transporter [Terriglobia bacterium]
MIHLEKYFFALTIVAALVLTFFLLRPFFTYLVLAGVLTYFLRPAQRFLLRYLHSRAWGAAILIVLVILLIVLPSFYLAIHLINQVTSAYNSFKDVHSLDRLTSWVQQKTGYEIQVTAYLLKLLANVRDFLLQAAPNVLGSLAELVLGLFVMFFVMYYALQQPGGVARKLAHLIPLEPGLKDQMIEEIHSVLEGVLYGQVITAIVQGFLGGLGFLVFGVPNAIFWGVMMMILSFIPFVGTPVVWVPAGIALIIDGRLWHGVGLLAFSALVVANVDNVLKPRLISGRSNIHPAVVMIGVLGGLKLFGFIGLIIGPLVLALLIRLVEFYEEVYVPKQA